MALCSRFESGAKWERERDGVVAWLVQWGKINALRLVGCSEEEPGWEWRRGTVRQNGRDGTAVSCQARRGDARMATRNEFPSFGRADGVRLQVGRRRVPS